jgi:hypothetical protein
MRPIALFLAVLSAASAAAAPLTREEVPGPLASWISWALRGHEQAFCSFLHAQERRDCAWPATLRLALTETGGSFTQDWTVQAPSWIPLPGGPERWPQDVLLNGKPAVVVRRDDFPAVHLPAGAHTVSGALRWSRLPEQLEIPSATGLLSLTVRGTAVPFPTRDELGRLWLQPRAQMATARHEDSLQVTVHRRLIDDIPLQLLTKLQIKISGGNREALLGRALPEGFVPMSLVSPLPARLDTDGRLRVQARAGTWELMLVSRMEGRSPDLVIPPQAAGLWGEDEAWVFESKPNLRQAELEGAPALDPQQTELPQDWKNYPAFLVRPGTSLKLVERQRGEDPAAPDRLHLQRELWLDFDGGGYSARDTIAGTLARSWRLEAAAGMQLGRVAIAGFDQFLTALSSGGPAGLELRATAVSLVADSRIAGRGLAAAGWSHDFESLSANLHLPPGWRLLHAGGVDAARPSWVTNWSLLDLFLVLIAATAFSRLWGPRWGAVALAGIGLSWHEPGAIRWLWLWLAAAVALERALADHALGARPTRYVRQGLCVLLALSAIPFAVAQARLALYAQLELPHMSIGERQSEPQQLGRSGSGGSAAGSAVDVPEEEGELDGIVGKMGAMAKSIAPASTPPSLEAKRERYASGRYAKMKQIHRDPQAQVSTGPGLPHWNWNRVQLSWKGPVAAGQRLSLWLTPPWFNAVLSWMRIILVALLALLLAGLPVWDVLRGPAGGWHLLKSLLPAALLILLTGAAGAQQNAFPPREIIDELLARLLERPDCAPLCAESPRLRIEATPSFLSLQLELHAAAPTAVPIPSGGREWTPARATLNGTAARVRRAEDGSLWLPLPAGAHRLTLDGPLPERDAVQIALPLKPRLVVAAISGWQLNGLRDDGRPENALQLSRSRAAQPDASAAARAQGVFPPLLRVERVLRLGLSWEVETRVTRLTPGGSPVSVQIPLLPGESVTSAEPRVVQGKVQLSLAPQAYSVVWRSTLKESTHIALAAPQTLLWTEVWRIEPSALWHVTTEGLPRVRDESEGARAYLFRPWPGESVALVITRPDAVPGQTLTIDQSVLQLSPGLRATDATLTLSLRSSRGGRHTVTLPDGASLLSVQMDGAAVPLRLEGRKLTIPVRPGPHVVALAWRQPAGAGLLTRAPQVDLGAPSVNAHVHLAMPRGRWTLLAGGPGIGPAVLFWSLLTIFLLVSLGLGKTELTPLSWRHWFLLSLGMTQIHVTAAAIIAGWFLTLGLRAQHPPQQTREFRLAQIFLVALTVAAALCLFRSIQRGLLGLPDMQIAGNGSTADLLRWYLDRTDLSLPRPWVLSAPLGLYRIAMLAWALWLAQSLLRWTRWAWSCFNTAGSWK